jgi:hypothetical protein
MIPDKNLSKYSSVYIGSFKFHVNVFFKRSKKPTCAASIDGIGSVSFVVVTDGC